MPDANEPTVPANSAEPPETPVNVDRKSVEGTFIAALSHEHPAERQAFLDQACAGDAERRLRVEALLRAYADAGSFLQEPAGDWRRPPVADPAAEAIDEHGIPRGLLTPSYLPNCLGTLGPYQIREFLGRGGMGIVFKALDPMLDRIVAIKALSPELSAQAPFRQRFTREARAAAAVSHPHIVTIHAVDDASTPPFLVMECIVGKSLQQKIDQSGPLKLTEILRIGTQVAEGLAAAHKRGLVHRDIKPANILLENGIERVKITDFGLARSVDDVTLTRTGEVSGTPQFMSPEQALGQRVDHRSDLFSLGCVLYAMCTGRPPFRGDNVAAVVKRICDDPPRPILEQNPEIPAWLIDTIERLLAKSPDERIQTAAQVAELLSSQMAPPQRPSPPRTLQPFAPSTSWSTALAHLWEPPTTRASTLLVLLALGFAGYLLGRFVLPRSDTEAFSLALLVATCVPVYTFHKRSRQSQAKSWQDFASMFAGFLVMELGTTFGVDVARHSHVLEFGSLIGGLALLAFIVWVLRRSTVTIDMPQLNAPDRPVTVSESPPDTVDPIRAAALRPWKTLGWMAVLGLGLLVAVPILGIAIPILHSRMSAATTGTLVVDWPTDADTEVTQVILRRDGINNAIVYNVSSRPFRVQVPEGLYRAELIVRNIQDPQIPNRSGGEAMLTIRPHVVTQYHQRDGVH